jgi:hypothetical protein
MKIGALGHPVRVEALATSTPNASARPAANGAVKATESELLVSEYGETFGRVDTARSESILEALEGIGRN